MKAVILAVHTSRKSGNQDFDVNGNRTETPQYMYAGETKQCYTYKNKDNGAFGATNGAGAATCTEDPTISTTTDTLYGTCQEISEETGRSQFERHMDRMQSA